MNNQFPIPISDESDLDFYENYLNDELGKIAEPKAQLSSLLKAYIGKTVKIDIISNKPETRIGALSQASDDFLVLKTPNRNEIIIPLTSVKFLTILQNNTKLPHF